MEIRTKSGFECTIEECVKDDYELVEELAALETNGLVFPSVLKRLLGDQVEKLKDHVRGEDGKVSTKALMEEFKEILNQNKDTKN